MGDGGTSHAMTDEERMALLQKAITDLKARVPRHSVPAAMLVELEDLQEEMKQLQARLSEPPSE
jgi:uncharacterized membrane protein (DUF106 family)